jgi:pilus assembly protein Flp/PilA
MDNASTGSRVKPIITTTSPKGCQMLEMLQVYVLQLLSRFRKDEEGATMVEYGIMVGLIACVCIAAVTALGAQVNAIFVAITGALAGVAGLV